MKITKRQLRRIIKETLLREGAKEDVIAYYGEIADMHSDSDAMDDLLGDLTDADLVAAGWEGGKDEVENYEDDPMTVIDSLTPETLDRLVKSIDPDDLARAQGDQGEGEYTGEFGKKFDVGDVITYLYDGKMVTGTVMKFIPSYFRTPGGRKVGDDSQYIVDISKHNPGFGPRGLDPDRNTLNPPAWSLERDAELVK